MKCPACGKEAKATGKEWKFGQFDAKGYKCASCGKSSSAYYKSRKTQPHCTKIKVNS